LRRADVREPLRHDADVVVIGGGVNGTGVARDASLRGLRVVLLERTDFAFGASGNSTGLLHGGPRYLTYDPAVTQTSCLDSGHIQHIAPHLLFRVPFVMPIVATGSRRLMLELIDAFFTAYDRFQPLKRGRPHVRLRPDELCALEPGLVGGPALAGGVSFDEWGTDGARLCIANVVDAIEHGAEAHNHADVVSIRTQAPGGPVCGVTWRDLLTGRPHFTTASTVVNATGAWNPATLGAAGLPASAAAIRPGKGVHVVYDRRLTNFGIVATAIDGRQVFLEPWQNVTLVGTTDDDYYGDPDTATATSEEARYLVQGIAQVFPAIAGARAIGTTAGVRSTLFAYGPNEDALSRAHRIVAHAKDGVPGLFSMIGGKLASYRLFAEQMTDVLVGVLGKAALPCRTATSKLPGGDPAPSGAALAERLAIDGIAAGRMLYRHGSRVSVIAEAIEREPRRAEVVCACDPVTEAEVRHVVRHELAMTVSDVARRTRLGQGPCGGFRCAIRAGAIVADELDLSPAEGRAQALAFLARQAKKRAPVVGRRQAVEEALAIAALRSELGVDPVEIP
jgi:glycerol-3-phosphate dehydrogenase